MAGIWNINGAYDLSTNKIHKRLSFELGEKFSARIINIDELTSEVMLKLLDGWEFSAQIKDQIDFNPHKLVKFQVEGYKEGKILVKVLNDENNENESSIVDTLEEQGINVKKEDYNVLKKMVKYNMPLTKDNISKIKSLLEFQNKIIQEPSEEDNFILKYVDNKVVDLNSEKGHEIQKVLKGFFKEFKNLNMDEIFTLIENDIELTEENIKSFNKINKESFTIYKDIKDIIAGENLLDKRIGEGIDKEIKDLINLKQIDNGDNIDNEDKKVFLENSKEKLNTNEEITSDNASKNLYNKKIYTNESKEIDGKEILRRLLELDSSNDGVELDENFKVQNKLKEDTNEVKSNEVKLQKDEIIDKNINKVSETSIKISDKIKEEFDSKINEMKNLIKHVLDKKDDVKSEAFNKIIQNLQSKMNDFKVFNSLSNQYYYLDVPINISDREYPCKLIVKDDRKNGKKIDSTNVKFVVSVKTLNMGTVDTYIKFTNGNINLDIKCEKEWIKLFDLSKEKIIDKLINMGYLVTAKIDEKKKDADLIECKNFFDDSEFTRINLRV